MTKIYEELQRYNGRAISHFRYGYEELPNSMMLFYPLEQLNNPKFDFRSAKPKKVSYETQRLSDAKEVVWYEDSIKESDGSATSTVAAGVLTFDTDIVDLVAGDILRNKVTGDVMLVLSVVGASATVDQNPSGVTTGDLLVRAGFAKTYGVYDTHLKDTNDYTKMTNYIQFTSEKIDPAKTDILSNNISKLFWNDARSYVEEELFAPASRRILLSMMNSLYAGRPTATAVTGGTKYTAGGLEYYIPASAKNINFKGGTDKESVQNFRTQLQKAYQSGVRGLFKKGRVVFFCTTAMAAQIDDLFYDKITNLDNHLSSFGINIVELSLNGRKISIVEDSVMNNLYGEDEKVGFVLDIEGVVLFNLMNDVIGEDGKSVPKLGASKLFVKPQDTYEMREISLNTHRSFVFKNVKSGVFRKLIYA